MNTMTLNDHKQKAQMILDNTRHLYDRQQAIFKVYMLTGDHDNFTRQLIDLAKHVVMQTNLSETADPMMLGATFDRVQADIYAYMIDDYHTEFVRFNKVENDQIVSK